MPHHASRTGRHGKPRHRRAHNREPWQPIFESPIPAPTPTGHGLPIGRVGALAVALGIGIAAGTGVGMGVAHADEGSSGGTNDTPGGNTESRSGTSGSESNAAPSSSPESGETAPTATASPNTPADDSSKSSGDAGSTATSEIAGSDGIQTPSDDPESATGITSFTAERTKITAPRKSRLSARSADAPATSEPTTSLTFSEARTDLAELEAPAASVAPIDPSDPSDSFMTSWTATAEVPEAAIGSVDGAVAVAGPSAGSGTAPSATPGPAEPVESLVVLALLAWTRRELSRATLRDNDVANPANTLDLDELPLDLNLADSSPLELTAVPDVGDSTDSTEDRGMLMPALMSAFGGESTAAPTGADSVVTGIEDSTKIGGQLSGTDADTDAADLMYAIDGEAANGRVTVHGDGTWTYAPNLNFHGTDSFTYTISDGDNISDPVTVTLSITAVNDAPVGTSGLTGSGAEGSAITGTLSGADVDSTTLTYKVKSQAAHGTVTVNGATGAWTYTPAPNFNGADAFTYTVSDGKLVSTPVTVHITVNAVNSAPTGTDSTVTAVEDVSTGGRLTGSDVETPASGLTYALAGGAGHGTATVSTNGTWTYTPDRDYDGTDSFTYTITDGAGATSAPVTVTITVTPVNDAPVGTTGLSGAGDENTTFGGTLTGTDIDTPTGGLTYAVGTGASHGTVTVDADGTWTYTPDRDYTGADSFSYTVFDGKLRSTPATVTITVASANTAPTGTDTAVTAVEDTAKIGGKFTGSDAETPAAGLTYAIGSGAAHGTATVNADGTWTYTPAANYSGADSFTYIITDGAGATSTPVTVSVVVTPVNDAPVGTTGLTGSGAEGSAITGTLTGSDIDSSNLTFAVKGKPAHGTVTITANGTWTYTPTTNYHGTDSFTFTVSDGHLRSVPVVVAVNVAPVDNPPTGTDSHVTVIEDGTTGGTLTGTDTDGDTLTYAIGTPAGNGTATINTDGTWTYTPTTNYHGPDSFTYTINDGTSSSTPVTVTVTVTPVNDAPTATAGLTGSGSEDAPITGTLTGADIDGDTNLTYTLSGQAAHGTVTIDPDGTWTYTPAANFHGPDSFSYIVSDGALTSTPVTVAITVATVNDAPTGTDSTVAAVEDTATGGTLTGTDTDGDTLTYAIGTPAGNGTVAINPDGTWTYTPTTNFNGQDSFSYTVSDGTLTSTPVTVTVTVAAVNDAPTGTDSTVAGVEDTATGGTLVGTDIDSGSLSYTLKSQAAHGTVTINPDGTWTYTPAANYTGTDSFTYTASDGALISAPITVTVNLAPVNDAPTGTDSTATGIEDSTRIGGQLTGSDVDNTAAELVYALDSDASHGAVTVNPDGTWTYTPVTDYAGADSFTYTINDGQSISTPVTVTITVPAVNDRPVGTTGLSQTGDEDTVITGTVTGTDTDTPAGNLTYALSGQAGHGTVTINPDGTWTYTPTANYHGDDTFTFTVYDQQLRSTPVSVTIHVTPVNDAPTATTSNVTAVEDGGTTGGTFTGTDVDGDPLSYALDTAAGNGTATVNADGTWTYTPTANYSGPDSFSYTVTDGALISTPVIVTVTVSATNDAPAGSDSAVDVDEDSAIGDTMVGTDSDGDTLAYVVGTPPAHGTVILDPDGTWTYTPVSNYHGTDSFTYTVSDGSLTSTPVTVTVTIKPVNDAPTADDSEVGGSEDTPFGGMLTADDIDTDAGDLRFKLSTQAANGTVALNDDGSWTYTPDPGFSGEDLFTYTVDDGNADSAPVTVTLYVAAVNGAPTGHDAIATGNEDTVVSGTLTGTDSDTDAEDLTYALGTGAAHGIVVVDPDGTWTYTPAANFNGTDSFTYTVSDSVLRSGQATVTIHVVAVNDVPTGTDSTVNVTEDVAAGGTFVGADVDSGTTLSYTLHNQAANGTVTINANGTWTYTPTPNFHGSDSFSYTVTDGALTSTPVTVTVTVTVTPVNDTPTGTNSTVTGIEDTTTGGTLTATDIDGDTNLTYTLSGQAANGTVTINTDGTWTYTPTTNFNGSDSFTYTVTDGALTSTPVTVTVTVTPVNDTPTGTNSTVTGIEDTATGGTLVGTDIDSGSMSYLLHNQAANGTVTINTDGTWTYIPNADYTGADSFTYTITDGQAISTPITVTINLAAVNDAPTGTNSTVTGIEDTTTGGTLTATDIDGDTNLTYTLSGQAANGTVTINPDGTWTYTPTTNFNGSDSFTYTVTDGALTSTPVTVTVTVTPVNDTPTGTNSTVTGIEDTTTGGTLVGTDIEASDPSQLSYVLVTDASRGEVNVNEDGTWTYTPNADYNGTDSFTYTIFDADGASSDPVTVTITLSPVNDAPVGTAGLAASGAEDSVGGIGGTLTGSDVDSGDTLTYAIGTPAGNGTVTINADGTWTYTPTTNFNGQDSFTYTVTDGTATSAPVTVTVTVTPVNDAPIATAGLTGSGNEDTPITGTLTGTDVDGDALTYTLSAQASRGTVTVDADGGWTYTPTANYTGPDSFSYTVTDGTLTSTPVTVTISVIAVNDAPVAQNDSYTTAEDTALTIGNLLTNDTDADGITLSVVGHTQPAHGSVTVNEDGSFTYTPTANFSGTDGFSYTIADQDGLTSTASVTIAVTAVNDQPVGNPDSYTTAEDSSYTGNVLGNDSDADGNTLTASIVVGPQHGSLQWNPNGTFTYTPDTNYNGTDTFTYQASDGPTSATATLVTMTVTAVNDVPTAGGAISGGSGNEDTAITGTVSFGDADAGDATDPDSTTLSVTTQAEHGTVVLNQNGSYSYTPTGNYHGTDSFTYTVTDAHGASATATVTLSVAAVNDVPVAAADSFGTTQQSSVKETPTQVIGNVLLNDTDVDTGDTRTITSYTQPTAAGGSTGSIGTVVVAANGDVTYTPNANGYHNYDGAVTFSYTITDSQGATSTNTVSFTLNDDIAPTAVDVQTTNSGTTGLTNQGDTITYTFSEPIDPNTVLAGWDGTGSRTVTVRVNDGAVVSLLGLEVLGANDSLQIYDSTNSTQLSSLGTVNLGATGYASTTLGLGGLLGTYYTFTGSTMTMSADRKSIIITLNTYVSDSVLGLGAPVRNINGSNNTLQWITSTAPKDIAGNSGSGNTATETSTADRDF